MDYCFCMCVRVRMCVHTLLCWHTNTQVSLCPRKLSHQLIYSSTFEPTIQNSICRFLSQSKLKFVYDFRYFVRL